MNEKPKFIPLEEQDIMLKKVREEKKANLDKLINENPYNKELFDYQKFAKLYWRQDMQGNDLNGSEGQETIDYYTSLYYGSFPEAKTIEDFAKEREKLDAEID